MQKKAMHVVIAAVTLGTAVVLYITWQHNTFRVEDILAVYQQNGDYGGITIEYPLDETLFPPEMVPPVFRWKDSIPTSKAWLVFASKAYSDYTHPEAIVKIRKQFGRK